jgi:hypothetical protein
VLDAFAVEGDPGRSTLERYLRLYPEYAGPLVDLSRELGRDAHDDGAPLSSGDQALIDAAWSKHAAARQVTVADPFAALSVDDWRAVALALEVPRQVVTALRERRVSFLSIPKRFLHRFAEAARSTVAELEASWAVPSPAGVRSFKADGKPVTGQQVTFEQVLIDAGIDAEKRARLLRDAD